MSLMEIKHITYCTPERIAKINPDNIKKYDKYLKSNIMKNQDVKNTTYRIYESNMKIFLCWLAENYDNIDLYSEEFMDDAVDIMESYMMFCQEEMGNHKKAINNKVACVSSFYLWSAKRGFIKYHPFKDKLDRMKKASEEHVLDSYYLTTEQLDEIRKDLYDDSKKWTIQDRIIFEIAMYSGNRLGALSNLKLSSLDIEEMAFKNVREKEGYIVDVPLNQVCVSLINEWVSQRENDFDKLSIDALLIRKSKDGNYIPWSRSMIYARCQKFGKVIGIDDFRTHCTRKTSINAIYEQTGDLNLASQWANHKSTAVTSQSYIKPISKAELRNKIEKLKQS